MPAIDGAVTRRDRPEQIRATALADQAVRQKIGHRPKKLEGTHCVIIAASVRPWERAFIDCVAGLTTVPGTSGSRSYVVQAALQLLAAHLVGAPQVEWAQRINDIVQGRRAPAIAPAASAVNAGHHDPSQGTEEQETHDEADRSDGDSGSGGAGGGQRARASGGG